MGIRKIITVPNNKLKQISKAALLDKSTLKLIKDLGDTLLPQEGPQGVGFSAPQLGINKRVFIVNLEYPSVRKIRYTKDKTHERFERPEGKRSPSKSEGQSRIKFELRAFINPKIVSKSKKTNWDFINSENKYFEGCLSVPGIFGYVERPWKIKVKYKTLGDKKGFIERVDEFEGFNAIYIQHERDHLDGILFTEHVLKQGEKLFEPTDEGFRELSL